MLGDVNLGADDAERTRRIAALEWDYAARELESVAACNLCAGTRFVELSRRDRYGYAAPRLGPVFAAGSSRSRPG